MLAGGMSPVRAEVEVGQGFTTVAFRRANRWMKLPAIILLAVGWGLGGIFAMVLIFASTRADWLPFVWLPAWIVLGLGMLVVMIWRTLALEQIVARATGLQLVQRILALRFSRDIPAGTIGDIRWVADDPSRTVIVNGRRIPQSALAISADGRHYRCATGITEAEAETAMAAIRQRLVLPRERR